MLRPALTLALMFACAAPGFAEEKGSASASFRFVRFSELPAVCAKDAHGKFVPVEAYTGFIGRPVRLPTKDAIGLIPCDDKGEPKKGEEDKPVEPIGLIKPLPDTPRQLVVLFGDGKKVVAQVVPDNPARFPYGRVLAVNLTDKPLLMEVGGKGNKLPAFGSTVCESPEKFVGTDNAMVRITSAGPERNRIYSTVWPNSTQVRTLAFIYKNESDRYIVRTITDANVPELAEAADPSAKKDLKGSKASSGSASKN